MHRRSSNAHYLQHPLHAWTVIVARIAFVSWAGALACAAVAVSRDRRVDGREAAQLALDLFFSAVGFPAMLVALCIIERASSPFSLPWITPQGQGTVACRLNALESYLERSVSRRRSKSEQAWCRPTPLGPRPLGSRAPGPGGDRRRDGECPAPGPRAHTPPPSFLTPPRDPRTYRAYQPGQRGTHAVGHRSRPPPMQTPVGARTLLPRPGVARAPGGPAAQNTSPSPLRHAQTCVRAEAGPDGRAR